MNQVFITQKLSILVVESFLNNNKSIKPSNLT